MRRVLFLALALAGSLALAPPAPARAAAGSERLDRLRGQIEEREERARSFREKAEGQLGALEALDRELADLRASARELRQQERTAEEELGTVEIALAEAKAALDRAEKALGTRLVALYKYRSAGGLAARYTAGDFQRMANRGDSLARIVAEDQRLAEEHRTAQRQWEEQRAIGEALVAEIREARREAAAREDGLRRKLVERRNFVDLLRTRSDREERAVEELRQAAERLEEALGRMPSSPPAPAGAGLQAGALAWPVEGARPRVGFGRQVDPEFGTQTLRNGVELEAPAGSPVHAVAPGRVLFSGWFRGYGQMVILDHGGDDVTVSGYLDELRVEAGDEVRSGDVIGTVGETGSLSGPGLYFEIRHAGQPVDPTRWLQSRDMEGTQ